MKNDYQVTSKPQEVVTRDIERNDYDLSHFSLKCGHIGRLQTFSVIKVNAGDSISLQMDSVIRLSPLRHYMYLDCMVDLFVFYVKDRYVYGNTNWTDFMKSGTDESVTLGTDSFTGSNRPECLGLYWAAGQTVPRWANRPYIEIWNNYFADPQVSGDQKAEDYLTTLTYPDPILKYGLPVCHLKRSWNTGISTNLTTADYRVALTDTNTTLDLYDLAAMKGRLQSEQARDWFGVQRYRDILKYIWDSEVNTDVDSRPELVMRKSHWLSGRDVDGTDDATLGSYTGKSVGVFNIGFPMKFIPEHGTIWVMGVLRFPPIVEGEIGYLASKAEPTYKQFAGDPMLIAREAPVSLNVQEQFGNVASSVDLGKIPYGQWFREWPNMLSADYMEVAGHPFMSNATFTSRATTVYVVPSVYNLVFLDTLMGHWQAQSYLTVHARRFIPRPEDSIFAGTK